MWYTIDRRPRLYQLIGWPNTFGLVNLSKKKKTALAIGGEEGRARLLPHLNVTSYKAAE
jgi:hypothetical protein